MVTRYQPRGPYLSKKARRTLSQLQQRMGLLNMIYTVLAFCTAALLVPALISLFIITNINRYVWLRILQKLYPNHEFINSISVRSTVDTPRNQGIFTLLLQVKGSCDINMFRSRVQRELLNRTKNGSLMFPHLRTRLMSLWGWKVWDTASAFNFNLDKHVVLTPPIYQSRLKSDVNIQKYISCIVSKYINPDLPPWQLTIIPSSDRFYLLVRLHHIYLSQENLVIGNLLLLEPEQSSFCEEIEDYLDNEHLLAGTFKTPVAIPQVYQHVSESFSNFWNELVSVYDPLENPKVHSSPTLKTFTILVIITTVSILKAYFRSNNPDLRLIIKEETQKRYLTKHLFWKSFVTTIHPLMVVMCLIQWCWWFAITILLHLLRTILNIPVYMYWLVLGYHMFREVLYLARIIFTGPRVILKELFSYNHKHHLQTVSLCGRKAISWSNPVPAEYIQRIRETTGASGCEILLSAISASLRDYFHSLGIPIPHAVHTTSHFIPQEILLSGSLCSHHDDGYLYLNLPIHIPDEPLENLSAVQGSLQQARYSQAFHFLASILKLDHSMLPWLLPSSVASILLYSLSRKYTITITQVDAVSNERHKRRQLWGQEVENVMYWRPSQAKISLAITLMSYGDSVRMGVMADTRISPEYSIISSSFDKHIGQLAVACGVSRRLCPASISPTPSDSSPSIIPVSSSSGPSIVPVSSSSSPSIVPVSSSSSPSIVPVSSSSSPSIVPVSSSSDISITPQLSICGKSISPVSTTSSSN